MSRTLLTLLLVLAAGVAAGQAYQGPRIRHSAEADRRMARHKLLRKQAQDAETVGDYTVAESLYKEAAALYPYDPFERIDLARLYDRAGRDRDAFVAYRAVLVGAPGAQSSEQREPAVLARYGDLCLRFSTVDEARLAYRLAAEGSSRDDVHEPTPAGRGDGLAALRAAAHTASGVVYGGSGDDEKAIQELDVALRAVPDFWITLYYRAQEDYRLGRRADAVRDAARAEALATPKGREQVRWLRWALRLPDPAGNLIPISAEPGRPIRQRPPRTPGGTTTAPGTSGRNP